MSETRYCGTAVCRFGAVEMGFISFYTKLDINYMETVVKLLMNQYL
jgi:hypothetical protein